MLKKVLVIGAGGHARPVISTAITANLDVVGVLDTRYQNKTEFILGVPVLGGVDKVIEFDPEAFCFVLAIGDNSERNQIFEYIDSNHFDLPNVLHPTALIDTSATLGGGNFVGPFAHIGPEVRIGDGNIINSYANIEHETKLSDFNQIAPAAVICGRCEIGSHVFVGANAAILEKLKVASQTVIGAGAVITKDIFDQGKTFVGVPGKSI